MGKRRANKMAVDEKKATTAQLHASGQAGVGSAMLGACFVWSDGGRKKKKKDVSFRAKARKEKLKTKAKDLSDRIDAKIEKKKHKQEKETMTKAMYE